MDGRIMVLILHDKKALKPFTVHLAECDGMKINV